MTDHASSYLSMVLRKATEQNPKNPAAHLCKSVNYVSKKKDLDDDDTEELCESLTIEPNMDGREVSVCTFENNTCRKQVGPDMNEFVNDAIEEVHAITSSSLYDDDEDDSDDDDDFDYDDFDDDDDVEETWSWMHDSLKDEDEDVIELHRGDWIFPDFTSIPKVGLLKLRYDRTRDYLAQFFLDDLFSKLVTREDAEEILKALPPSHRAKAAHLSKFEGPDWERKYVKHLMKLSKVE